MSAELRDAGSSREELAAKTPDATREQTGSPGVPQEGEHERDAARPEKERNPFKKHLPWVGTRSQSDKERQTQPLTPADSEAERRRRVTFDANRTSSMPGVSSPLSHEDSNTFSQHSKSRSNMGRRRSSINPRLRPEENVYHDSRAATRREWRRRGTTLQDYYRENPTLLPQLPFTFRHGFKRWKLALLILFMVFDACVVPIILYYAMTFGGHIEGWITFAVVTAIWGGPAYFEFAVRSFRLILKERFFRPLGATGRWHFDITNWIFVASLTATTALLIIGAAPHIVWLRVLSLPGPALLLTLGTCIGIIDIFSFAGRKAPFRLSSTPKGGQVHPGIYYIVEDIVAVNAGGGLPFREGFAARYEASPVFRRMIRQQSIFWSIGSIVMGLALIVIVCIHQVKKEIAYGVGWATPFVWAAVWAAITIPWVRHMMHIERTTWQGENEHELEKGDVNAETDSALVTTPPATGDANGHPA